MPRHPKRILPAAFALMALAGCTEDKPEAPTDAGTSSSEAQELGAQRWALEDSLCGDTSGMQVSAWWGMAGGCPTKAAQSSEYGAATNDENWSTYLYANVESSAVIDKDGFIYVGNDLGKLYKIDSADGSIVDQVYLWGGIKSTPAIAADGTIYVAAGMKLWAVDSQTMDTRWSYLTLAAITASPVIAGDGTIYIGSYDTKLHAVNPDGSEKWRFHTGSLIKSSAAVGPDGTVYFGSDDNRVRALNPDGTLKWERDIQFNDVESSPAVGRFGNVFVGSDANVLHALDAQTGDIVWERELGDADVVSSPAVDRNGVVYIGGGDNTLRAFSSDGDPLWTFEPPEEACWWWCSSEKVVGSPIIDREGSVFFGSTDDHVYKVDATGQLTWAFETGGSVLSSPALGPNGAVVVGSNDNRLYSIGVGIPRSEVGGPCAQDQECEPGLVCSAAHGDALGHPAGGCVAPSCTNGVQDSGEERPDCGGSCGPCAGQTCPNACAPGSEVLPESTEVLSFEAAAFRRETRATYVGEDGNVHTARGNELRWVLTPEGTRAALLEGERINRLEHSEELQGDSWQSSATVSSDATTAPDGVASADVLDAAQGLGVVLAQGIANPVASTLSFWARRTGSGGTTRVAALDHTGTAYSASDDLTVGDAWSREALPITGTFATGEVRVGHAADWPLSGRPALGASQHALWGWQLEEGPFASSYIPTDDGPSRRAADHLVVGAASVPAWLKGGTWQLDVWPQFSASEAPDGERYVLLSFGDNDYLALLGTGRVTLVVGGAEQAGVDLDWLAGQRVTVTVALATGTLTVGEGAAAAQAASAGAALVFPNADLRIGGMLGGGDEAFAALSEPRKVDAASTTCTVDPSWCTPACPCDSGLGGCMDDNSCSAGLTCGSENGSLFGYPPEFGICWSASCEPPATGDCGAYDAECGLCGSGFPCLTNSDCGPGLLCGEDNGVFFGLDPSLRACWDPACSGPRDEGCGLCGNGTVDEGEPCDPSAAPHCAPNCSEESFADSLPNVPDGLLHWFRADRCYFNPNCTDATCQVQSCTNLAPDQPAIEPVGADGHPTISTLGGRVALLFDGERTSLAMESARDAGSDYTVLAVVDGGPAAPAKGHFWSAPTTATGSARYYAGLDTGTVRAGVFTPGAGNRVDAIDAIDPTVAQLITYQDGATEGLASGCGGSGVNLPDYAFPASNHVVGSSATPFTNTQFAGRIAEILVFDRRLSPGELEPLRAYLSARYSLEVSCAGTWCGDGVTTAPEVCDFAANPFECAADCSGPILCGNGALDPDEECDPSISAYCNHDCTSLDAPTVCDTIDDCPLGQECGWQNGHLFGLDPDQNVCWPIEPCRDNPEQACGTENAACGSICECQPDCSAATCGSIASDGCGGICTGTCAPLEPGCQSDSECPGGFVCGIGEAGSYGGPAGENVCRPATCSSRTTKDANCGSTSDLCGLCETRENLCGSRQCGTDENGNSCGTCAAGTYCSANGQCGPRILLDGALSAANDIEDAAEVGTLPGAFRVGAAGQATYHLPFDLPPGPGGHTPRLSLVYRSNQRKGTAGRGWSLAGLSAIQRCPARHNPTGSVRAGIRNDETDDFCLNGQHLVAVGGGAYGNDGTQYRTETDSHAQILSYGLTNGSANGQVFYKGPDSWEVRTKSGLIMRYGIDRNGRKIGRREGSRVHLTWYLQQIEDRSGNTIHVRYDKPRSLLSDGTLFDSEVRPVSVQYGYVRVAFEYADSDPDFEPDWTWIRAGGGTANSVGAPLNKVVVNIEDTPVRSYTLAHERVGNASLLRSVTGCVRNLTGGEQCKPPTVFEYDEAQPGLLRRENTSQQLTGEFAINDPGSFGYNNPAPENADVFDPVAADLNGDGFDDLIYKRFVGITTPSAGNPQTTWEWVARLSEGRTVDARAFTSWYVPLPIEARCQLRKIDWNNDDHDDLFVTCPVPNKPESWKRFWGVRLGKPSSGEAGFDLEAHSVSWFVENEGSLSEQRITFVPERTWAGDINGDGLTELLGCTQDDKWLVGFNNGPFSDPSEEIGVGELPLQADCKNAQVVDYDGDGVANIVASRTNANGDRELVALHGYGDTGWETRLLGHPIFDVGDPNHLRLADVNGDGIRDVIIARDNQLELALGTGAGWQTVHQAALPDWYNNEHFAASFVMDSDADGRQELWIPVDDVGYTIHRPLTVRDGRPGMWNVEVAPSLPFVKINISQDEAFFRTSNYTTRNWQAPIVMDWDGDGVQDIVTRGGADDPTLPTLEVRRGSGRHHHLLTSTTNGMGLKTSITYDVTPSGVRAYSPGRTPREREAAKRLKQTGHALVAGHSVSGFGGRYATLGDPAPYQITKSYEYSYTDARRDITGRGWLGFGSRVMERVQFRDSAIRDVLSATVWEYDFGERDPELGYWKAGRPVTRRTRVVTDPTLYTGTDATLHEFVDSWERSLYRPDAGSRNRPYVKLDQRTTQKLENTQPVTAEGIVFREYDEYGHFGRSLKTQAGHRSAVSTEVTYDLSAARVTDWLINLPEQVVQTGWLFLEGPSKVTQHDTVFDDQGRPEEITRSGRSYDEPLTTRQITTLGYDSFGNVVSTDHWAENADARRLTTTVYDEAGVFPVRLENGVHEALEETVRAVGADMEFGIEVRHEPWNGNLAEVSAPDGSWQQYRFDGFGRPTSTETSEGESATLTYGQQENCTSADNCSPLTVVSDGNTIPFSGTQYNAFGQEVLTTTLRAKSTPVLQEFNYDSRGRLAGVSVPHAFTSPPLARREYFYDNLGRMTEERYPYQDTSGGTATASAFHHWPSIVHADVAPELWENPAVRQAHVWLNNGTAGFNLRDGRGLVVETIDGIGQRMNRSFGAFGHLEAITREGAGMAVLSNELGQTTGYTDTDRGYVALTLSGFGNVVQKTRRATASSPDGETTTLSYDGLGRLVYVGAPDAQITRQYDGDGFDRTEIGKPIEETIQSATAGNATTAYQYRGPNGLLSQLDRTIEGEFFSTNISYGPDGLPEVVSYPLPENSPQETFEVRYAWERGELIGVANNNGLEAPYWTLEVLDQFGGVSDAWLGNGVRVQHLREPETGALERITTTSDRGLTLQDTAYAYEARGVLRQVTHNPDSPAAARVIDYGHDALDRIDWVNDSVTGGVDYSYDPIGNLEGTAATSNVTTFGGARPHAPQQQGDRTFRYDDFGRREGWTSTAGTSASSTIQYASSDLPTLIEQTSSDGQSSTGSFLYDANDQRTVKEWDADADPSTPNQVTTYVGDAFRRVRQPDGSEEHYAVVQLPGGVGLEVLLGDAANQNLYQHQDNLGSVMALSTDVPGFPGPSLMDQRSFLPFGQPAGMWSSNVNSGFTGHEHDSEFGLVNMKGRMYDPTAGAFLTPDPIVGGDYLATQLNPYAYVRNSPLNWVDPSGLQTAPSIAIVHPSGDEPGYSLCIEDCAPPDPGLSDAEALDFAFDTVAIIDDASPGNLPDARNDGSQEAVALMGMLDLFTELDDGVRDNHLRARERWDGPATVGYELFTAFTGFGEPPPRDDVVLSGKHFMPLYWLGRALAKAAQQSPKIARQLAKKGGGRKGSFGKFRVRSKAEVKALRREFDTKVRKEFARHAAKNEQVARLVGKDGVAALSRGHVPKGWVVHHRTPLFRGGTNDFSNLTLMKKADHTLLNRLLHFYRGSNPLD